MAGSFLVPQVRGAQWELGAVGNAEWMGVPLRALLERAGLEDDACEVVLEGADRGILTEEPIPPGPISYACSLPRAKAVQPEALIAYQMNGRDLSRDHGCPARAIVPGHYGMGSVKWLTRIQAAREPFQRYWPASDYGYWDFLDGKSVRRPLAEIKLKSAIARPRVYETLSSTTPSLARRSDDRRRAEAAAAPLEIGKDAIPALGAQRIEALFEEALVVHAGPLLVAVTTLAAGNY